MTDNCTKMIVMPQYTGTCWFNALIMALFYSQGLHNVLLTRRETWNMTQKLKKTLYDILERRSKTYISKKSAYAFFNVITPEYILQLLYKENPNVFKFNPEKRIGYMSEAYLPQLMKMLGIENKLHLDAVHIKDNIYDLYYSNIYQSFKIQTPEKDKEKKIPNYFVYYNKGPIDKKTVGLNIINNYDVITFRISELDTHHPSNIFMKNVDITKDIRINNQEYIHDSLLLTNFNTTTCKLGHEIAGITCGNDKYIYNGWILKKTQDPSMIFTPSKQRGTYPCELMKHDWLLEYNDFCLNPSLCKLDNVKKPGKTLCFNVHKGNRTYILVQKKYMLPQIVSQCNTCSKEKVPEQKNNKPIKNKSDSPCPEGKVRNPNTGRCIKEKVIKDCQEGKIRNPKTGRCIKVRTK